MGNLFSGLAGFYRGITSNIASSAPISAVYTFTYESVKGALLPLFPKVIYVYVCVCVCGTLFCFSLVVVVGWEECLGHTIFV